MPETGLHALHLAFISGFGLLTLLVASRVTLAHGGYDLSIEKRSRVFKWAGGWILAAALVRASAPLTAQAYFHHLAYAAACWIIGVGIWAAYFVPRMLARRRVDRAA